MTKTTLPAILLCAAFCNSASAQDDVGAEVIAATLLVEASFSEPDHIAILSVLERRARQRGVSITRQAILYSSAWRHPQLPARVADAIERYPDKWQRTLELVRAFLRGELRTRCTARHWGAPNGLDLIRAQRAGWRPVRCGATANLFWK